MLDVTRVSKRFGELVALDDVSLQIESGTILCLLGPNGAGKTTLMSIVGGLLRPDQGSVLIDGMDVAKVGCRARRTLGFVPQETGVYPLLTVRENLTYFAELAGLRRSAVTARVLEVAAMLDLEPMFGQHARALSGGQKRRLHTALGLLHRPRLLLLDEPTAGVDPQTRQRLLAAVVQMANEGAAICYTTHYMAEVESLPATVAVIDHGRVIASGAVHDIVDADASTIVEVAFTDALPDLGNLYAEVDGLRARVPTEKPTHAIEALVRAADKSGCAIQSIEVIRPSLESAFLRLTGRRLDTPTDVSAERPA